MQRLLLHLQLAGTHFRLAHGCRVLGALACHQVHTANQTYDQNARSIHTRLHFHRDLQRKRFRPGAGILHQASMVRQSDAFVRKRRQAQHHKQHLTRLQVTGTHQIQHGDIRVHSHSLPVGAALSGRAYLQLANYLQL